MLGNLVNRLNSHGGTNPTDRTEAQSLDDLSDVWKTVPTRANSGTDQTVNVQTVAANATPVRNQATPASQATPAKKPATEKPAAEDRIKLAKKRNPDEISLPLLLVTSIAMLCLSLFVMLVVAAIPTFSMRFYYTMWILASIVSAGIGYVGVRSDCLIRRSLFLEMSLGLCWPFAIPAVIAQFLPSLG